MTTTVKATPAKAPRASAKTFSPLAARRLAAERKKNEDAIAALALQIGAKEADCRRLQQAVQSNEEAQRTRRGVEDETLAPALEAAQKEFATLDTQNEELKTALRELETKMPVVAEEALRAIYPAAVQTQNELARLGEIEARLMGEKLAIERDCDPEDEAALKTLESVSIRLTVIPGKRERWQEKLAAQIVELTPFWEAGKHALSRALSAQRDKERARIEAALNPFFDDGKIPAIAENDLVSLLRETAAYGHLDRIENAARGFASGYQFELSLVLPLLAGFDALAALEGAS